MPADRQTDRQTEDNNYAKQRRVEAAGACTCFSVARVTVADGG